MIAIPQTVGAVAVEGIAPSGVIGEIYDVPEAMIPALDAYEDVPHLYTRVPVPLSEGALPSAMAYLLRPEHSAGRPVIPSGDWCRRTPGS